MPFQLENGTDYIGLEIADQLWLENDVPSGGIKWPRCCCQEIIPPTCDVMFHITGCNSKNLSGATVNVWNNSSHDVLIATGTTDTHGNATLSLGTEGTYWRQVSATGFTTSEASITVTCTCLVTFSVTACNVAGVMGATVNIWQDSTKAVLVTSGTTNSDGAVTLNVGNAGTYYREAIAAGCVTGAGSVTLTCDGTNSIDLLVASGYNCSTCCGNPWPHTLTLNDSLGDVTLTFTSSPTSGLGTNVWVGCAMRTAVSWDHYNAACSTGPTSGNVDVPVWYTATCSAQLIYIKAYVNSCTVSSTLYYKSGQTCSDSYDNNMGSPFLAMGGFGIPACDSLSVTFGPTLDSPPVSTSMDPSQIWSGATSWSVAQ